MAGLGVPELLIILVILLLVFGPKRLPQLGRQLGGGMREFKDSVTGKAGDDDEDETTATPVAAAPELTRAQQADVLDPTPDATRTPVGERDEPATRPGR
jgi:sec-independent protein translocase protein TatA